MTAARLRAEHGTCNGLVRERRSSGGRNGSISTRKFATESGRARFLPRPHRPPRETTDHEFPLVMTTGRIYAHLAYLDPDRQVTQALRPSATAVGLRRGPSRRRGRASGMAAGQLAELRAAGRGTLRLPIKTSIRACHLRSSSSCRSTGATSPAGTDSGQLPPTQHLGHRPGRQAARVQVLLCPSGWPPAPDAPEPATDFARTTRQDLPPGGRGRAGPGTAPGTDPQTPGIFLARSSEG